MTTTDRAILEVGNWLQYGECRREVCRAIVDSLTSGLACDDCTLLLLPDNQGGAWVVRRACDMQTAVHFLACGDIRIQSIFVEVIA